MFPSLVGRFKSFLLCAVLLPIAVAPVIGQKLAADSAGVAVLEERVSDLRNKVVDEDGHIAKESELRDEALRQRIDIYFGVVLALFTVATFFGYRVMTKWVKAMVADKITERVNSASTSEVMLRQIELAMGPLVEASKKKINEEVETGIARLRDLEGKHAKAVEDLEKFRAGLEQKRKTGETLSAEDQSDLTKRTESVAKEKSLADFTAEDWFLSGSQALSTLDYRRAVWYLSEALDNAETIDLRVKSLVARSRAHRGEGSLDKAVSDASVSLTLKPKNVDALMERGLTFSELKRYDVALADMTEAISLSTEPTWLYLRRAEIYSEMGKYAEAMADVDKAIEIDKNYAWCYAFRAEIYEKQGQRNEAFVEYNHAIQLDPEEISFYESRADLHGEMSDYASALMDLNTVISIDANESFAYARRAHVYKYMGEFEKALADANRAIDMGYKTDYIFTLSADIKTQLGKYDEALADAMRAIDLNNKSEWAYLVRASIYDKLGKTEEKQADRKRASELRAEDSEAS